MVADKKLTPNTETDMVAELIAWERYGIWCHQKLEYTITNILFCYAYSILQEALEQKETERASQSQKLDKGICINIHVTTHVDMHEPFTSQRVGRDPAVDHVMAAKRMKIVVSVRIVKICESLEDQDVKNSVVSWENVST